MNVFKYIAFLLLISIIGTTIYISVQPNTFKVSRTRIINVPAPVIYNHVIDFKNWKDWSSIIEVDSQTTSTNSKQPITIDSNYTWHNENNKGTIKTIETIAYKFIKQNMQNTHLPNAEIIWNFTSNANRSTNVTWSVFAKNLSFGFKASTIFSNGIEKQIGTKLEQTLKKLDSIVNAKIKKHSITVNGITNHSGGYYLYNTTSCKINELETKIKEMLPKVENYALKNNITLAGTPFINYIKWDEANNAVIFSCCVPTIEQVITAEGDGLITGKLNSFKALKTTLKGNYIHLQDARKTAKAAVTKNGHEFSNKGPMIETYLNNPLKTPNPANLITEIFIAIK